MAKSEKSVSPHNVQSRMQENSEPSWQYEQTDDILLLSNKTKTGVIIGTLKRMLLELKNTLMCISIESRYGDLT